MNFYDRKPLLCFGLLLLVCLNSATHAQNNPYKISDNLFAIMLRINKSMDRPEGLVLADSMFVLARKQGDVKAQCIALQLRCNCYSKQNDYDEILHRNAVKRCIEFSENTPYTQYAFGAWNTLISYMIKHFEYDQALKELEFYQAKAIRLQSSYGISQSNRRLGDLYAIQGLAKLAIEQYQQGIDYYLSIGETKQLFELYINQSSCYFNMKDEVTGYKKALLALENVPSERQKLAVCIQIMQNLNGPKDSRIIDEFYQMMISLKKNYGIDASLKDSYYLACSRYYSSHQKFKEALAYTDSMSNKKAHYYYISTLLHNNGKYDKARKALIDYIEFKDSINERHIIEMTSLYWSRFDNDRLQLERNRLALENARMRIQESEKERLLLQSEHKNDSITLKNRDLEVENQQILLVQKQAELDRQHERMRVVELDSEMQRRKAFYLSSLLMLFLIVGAITTILWQRYIRHLKKANHATENALIESNEAKQKMEEAFREVQKAEALKSIFLENLSHEIRTPLNAIVGFSDVLNSEIVAELEEGEKTEMLNLIHENTALLDTLFNDILNLSELESGSYKVKTASVSAVSICQTVQAEIRSRLPKGVWLDFVPSAKCPDLVLVTDGKCTQQILSNFLTNACKYTTEGSITLAYERCRHEDESYWVEFSVTDTGCGIPADKVDEIFGRFEKLDSFKQGTGLGLTICRSIAELLHGQVKLDTRYTRGCRFILELPLE